MSAPATAAVTVLEELPVVDRRRLRSVARSFLVTIGTAAVVAVGIGLTATPGGLAAQVGGALVVLACLGFAERAAGAFRAILLLAGPAIVAAPVSALLTAAQSSIGPAALWSSAWGAALDPVSLGMGLLLGTSAYLRPLWQGRIRMTLLVIGAVLVLYDGQPVEFARLIAGVVGLVLGIVVGPRSRPATPPSIRSLVIAVLAACGVGPLIVQMSADAEGVLAPLGAIGSGPLTTIVIPIALLTAAELTRRGRFAALPVAAVALSMLIVLAVDNNLVEPLRAGWIEWTGLTPSETQWQVGLISSWILPLVALILILINERGRRLLGPTAAEADPAERLRMTQLVSGADAGSLGHMTTWSGNRYWYSPRTSSAVAFRRLGRVALALADPIAPAARAAATIEEFAEHCDRQGLIPVFYGIHARHLPTFRAMHWHTLAAAEEAVIELEDFSLSGRRRTDLRTALNRAGRTGITGLWGRYGELPAPVQAQIRELFDQWVGGKKLPEMGFTLGRLAELDDPAVPVLVAVDEAGTVHAVTSWLPVWEAGRLTGYTLDVMRRRSDAMPGAMEFLIATAALRFQADGLRELSLSGSPLSTAPATTRLGRALERVAGVLTAPVRRAYGFESLARFKRKFQTSSRSLYIAFADPLTLPGIGTAIVRAYFPGLRLRDLRPRRR